MFVVFKIVVFELLAENSYYYDNETSQAVQKSQISLKFPFSKSSLQKMIRKNNKSTFLQISGIP